METRKLRKQTPKGMGLYHQRSNELFEEFKKCVSGLETYISSNYGLSISSSISSLNKCTDQCKELHQDVQTAYAEYMKYLDGVKTKESETEMARLDNSYEEVENKIAKKNKCKSEEERQKFLFENKLCYRCYSGDHQARDCKVSQKKTEQHGGERQRSSAGRNDRLQSTDQKQKVDNKCAEICGDNIVGKSCAKIMLVYIYTKDNPDNYVQCYATVDEQSNRCLAKPELFQLLNVTGKSVEYTMSRCNGISVKSGRELNNLVVEYIDKSVQFELPTVIECQDIPSNRNEIPTPSVAANHPHLSNVAPLIPEIDSNAKMLLLLGRDIPDVHHVLDQRLGPKGCPFAQRLPLGWVVIGEVRPCTNIDRDHMSTYDYDFVFALDVRHDDKASLSIDDRDFLSIMNKEFVIDSQDRWSAPLPFKTPRSRLPNNRVQALQRAKCLQANLSKRPLKRQHFVDFIGKLLTNGHAEKAPRLDDSTECCLLGVLLRFRRELVAVSVDVEQMFNCFRVHENDRNYLRFFWHEDNETSKPLIEYRLCKHVLGNSPSPAIANNGLRKAVEKSDDDVVHFVERDFYVDDGLMSCLTVSEATDLLQRTQSHLAKSGIRLHKIAST
ncbi:uncharacterized protein LOC128549197 [Mercenaria mercenaria]|uniref:uncharacterized protein LOC128549197 n=1 Tax=Mercenaria mercenaria TaxID=6596 RepID=UPI00234EB678|nr:uncharacterized protein LOC128549197 [Mercenaria mercenaria]